MFHLQRCSSTYHQDVSHVQYVCAVLHLIESSLLSKLMLRTSIKKFLFNAPTCSLKGNVLTCMRFT